MKNTSILLFLFMAVMATSVTASRANAESYHVNLILQRGAVSDSVWNEALTEFESIFWPSFQAMATGANFGFSFNNTQAVFSVTNATTSNFNQTYSDFQSIPSLLPSIPEFTVIIDGPYRGPGGARPPADISFNGSGKKTLRGNKKWKLTCNITNTTGIEQTFTGRIRGSMTKRKGCKIICKLPGQGNVYRSLKSIGGFKIAVGSPIQMQVVIQPTGKTKRGNFQTAQLSFYPNSAPAMISNKKIMCRPN